jgi:hypothetical protein
LNPFLAKSSAYNYTSAFWLAFGDPCVEKQEPNGNLSVDKLWSKHVRQQQNDSVFRVVDGRDCNVAVDAAYGFPFAFWISLIADTGDALFTETRLDAL